MNIQQSNYDANGAFPDQIKLELQTEAILGFTFFCTSMMTFTTKLPYFLYFFHFRAVSVIGSSY